mgnify:CR=1 FL=1
MYLHVNADHPNQSRDVFVHFSERCESRNDCKAVWTVWLGADQTAEFEDQFEAMRYARSLADERQLPAWLFGPEGQGLQRLGN